MTLLVVGRGGGESTSSMSESHVVLEGLRFVRGGGLETSSMSSSYSGSSSESPENNGMFFTGAPSTCFPVRRDADLERVDGPALLVATLAEYAAALLDGFRERGAGASPESRNATLTLSRPFLTSAALSPT